MTVSFIKPDGERMHVEGSEGMSLMEIARDNGVPGIDADCGGQCACATCHVFVDSAWLSRLPPMSDQEEAMLGMSDQAEARSRLCCQLTYTEALDGIVVQVPVSQF